VTARLAQAARTPLASASPLVDLVAATGLAPRGRTA
jgi:hypothetical protein